MKYWLLMFGTFFCVAVWHILWHDNYPIWGSVFLGIGWCCGEAALGRRQT